jgi:hypothetical protein
MFADDISGLLGVIEMKGLTSKIAIYLSLGLHKGGQSYLQKKPSALKREHTALRNMKFHRFFSIFVGHVCLSGSGFRIRILIRIH